MRISMMTYTMARGLAEGEQFDAVALCEFTRELGLEAIDWVRTYHYTPEEIRAITDDYGLENVAHTFFADFNFPTADERAPARDAFKQGVDAAVTLGAKIVMLPFVSPLPTRQPATSLVMSIRSPLPWVENSLCSFTIFMKSPLVRIQVIDHG